MHEGRRNDQRRISPHYKHKLLLGGEELKTQIFVGRWKVISCKFFLEFRWTKSFLFGFIWLTIKISIHDGVLSARIFCHFNRVRRCLRPKNVGAKQTTNWWKWKRGIDASKWFNNTNFRVELGQQTQTPTRERRQKSEFSQLRRWMRPNKGKAELFVE